MHHNYWLARRNDLTARLHDHPYDLVIYIERSVAYSNLEYHDLAAGDAYRALLLTDAAQDEAEEYHVEAGEALEKHLRHGVTKEGNYPRDICPCQGRDDEVATQFATHGDDIIQILAQRKALQCYALLAQSLLQCGCVKSAMDFTNRGLAASPGEGQLREIGDRILKKARKLLGNDKLEIEDLDMNELPDQGLARREIYPWNEHEPCRFSQENLNILNGEMSRVAPKCEVKALELPILADSRLADTVADRETATIKQLGVFAKAAIEPGEVFLNESSALIANNRLHESLCDACSSAFPDITSTNQPLNVDAVSNVVSCPDCDDIFFCNEKCLSLALQTYHPALCGKDVETIGKDAPLKETSNALYLVLLLRAIALAQTSSTNPLGLKDVKYLWGDFVPPSSPKARRTASQTDVPVPNGTLPFSFTYNIASPLHILEKLDLDIFTLLPRYDLWIFNTLYAKFRGTASARVSLRDGRPEVCAVHPMWALANHDCDPNAAWEWGGEMKFWARQRRVPRHQDAKIDGTRAEVEMEGGIAPGEEVLNHYCDIDLPVKERREWAVGSLGGWCMCERCKREEKEERARERRTAEAQEVESRE
ncbi:MAG: hypothetical protein M1837_002767 [Sclerophora amabilis]|nr:MAG: hypothetical protein M1837_002767 [Sclerophora amabilis]